jgi:hypothetical protein
LYLFVYMARYSTCSLSFFDSKSCDFQGPHLPMARLINLPASTS